MAFFRRNGLTSKAIRAQTGRWAQIDCYVDSEIEADGPGLALAVVADRTFKTLSSMSAEPGACQRCLPECRLMAPEPSLTAPPASPLSARARQSECYGSPGESERN